MDIWESELEASNDIRSGVTLHPTALLNKTAQNVLSKGTTKMCYSMFINSDTCAVS